METATDTLRSGGVEIRAADGLVLAGGRAIPMSRRELRLLRALLLRENHIVSREDLYRLAWDARLREGDRSVDVYVHKLRVKLEKALPGQAYIHTHFGFGYRFAPEPTPPLPDRTTGAG